MTIEQGAARMAEVAAEVKKAVVGQDEALGQVMAALVAGGHVLVEGMPGLGKTLLVRALAQALGVTNQRVQFTPDLMPSDIIGTVVYDLSTGKFTTRKGPVFTHLLLADEVNRAPAKTQAALLEVMQEYQVTFDGHTHALERPFLVLATQNPLEQEGTYPLPDAQLDRFLIRVEMDYPDAPDEVRFVTQILAGNPGQSLDVSTVSRVLDPAQVWEVQEAAATVAVAPQLVDYAVRLVGATRHHEALRLGAGPRATLALVRLARAGAFLQGRSYVTPDDVKSWVVPVLAHRVVPNAEWTLDGRRSEDILVPILDQVEAPRE
jgi:MoxR-like ATPase